MNTTTKIKKSIGHDSMSIAATLASGANLRFSIGRSGEKLAVGFSNDRKILNEQANVVKQWLRFRTGETNLDRFNRLENLLKQSKSGAEAVQLMTAEL